MKKSNAMSLAQFQLMFYQIYGRRNARMYGSSGLLLGIFEKTAVIDESFRKEDHSVLAADIARLFGWLVGFCNNEEVDLAKAVYNKYHGACPYCSRVIHCTCISAETKPKRWKRIDGVPMPQSLPAWQNMFRDIYGRVNKIAGAEKCWLHFHEELGEVSKEFRLDNRRDLEDELADTFAWLCAFCNNARIDLQYVVLVRYHFKCDTCKNVVCICPKV